MKRKYKRSAVPGKKNTQTHNLLFFGIGIVVAIVSAIILIAITAIIIKDMHLDDGAISVLATIIKILSSGICTYLVISKVNINPLIIGPISCCIYMIFSSALFLCLSQGKYFDLRVFFIDIVIGTVAGALFSLILGKKSLYLKNK